MFFWNPGLQTRQWSSEAVVSHSVRTIEQMSACRVGGVMYERISFLCSIEREDLRLSILAADRCLTGLRQLSPYGLIQQFLEIYVLDRIVAFKFPRFPGFL